MKCRFEFQVPQSTLARGSSKQKKASKNTWKWGTREGEAETHRVSYLRLERRENAKNAAHFLPRLSPLKRFNISRAVEKELRTQNLLHSCEKFLSRLFKRKHLKGVRNCGDNNATQTNLPRGKQHGNFRRILRGRNRESGRVTTLGQRGHLIPAPRAAEITPAELESLQEIKRREERAFLRLQMKLESSRPRVARQEKNWQDSPGSEPKSRRKETQDRWRRARDGASKSGKRVRRKKEACTVSQSVSPLKMHEHPVRKPDSFFS